MKISKSLLFSRNRSIYKIKPAFFSSTKNSYLASLDQSTTGTKFSIYQPDGTLVDQQIVPHTQISPSEGWLEHNPNQIYTNVQKSMQIVMNRLKDKINLTKDQILGLGISNQRETIVCWDQQGNPLYNALVWCDTRTQDVCKRFQAKYSDFSQKTGLKVSTYFSLFKILWMLENVEGLKQKVQAGKVRFGTIDSWVTYKLTGQYVTDASNASRTHLCDIHKVQWDPELMSIASLSQRNLPQIVKSFEEIGSIKQGQLKGVKVNCLLGDQQASAYAHNLQKNQMKITYGTGCFLLANIGEKPIYDKSFVTTILNKDENNKTNYGFEVSIECGGGTLNWANRMGFFEKYSELNDLPEAHKGLYFFPSFGSIFSPFWKTNIPGGVVGMGFNTTKQHVVRALLNSITYRLHDNIKNEEFKDVKKIIVDGGMTKNKMFMQMQADLFQKQIQVRTLDTCWGVAKGVLSSQKIPIRQAQFQTANYQPSKNSQELLQKYEQWCEQRRKLYGWK